MYHPRLLPTDPAALRLLASELEAVEGDLSAYMDDMQAAYRAARRSEAPPPTPRCPRISLMVRSYMLPHSLDCLRTGALAGVRVALADMRELHRDARAALDALADRTPPAVPSPSGTTDSPARQADQRRGEPAAAGPAGSPRGERQAGDQLDEDAIADALAARGYQLEAVFVRHFKGRQSTTQHDLVRAVCGDEDMREWSTVKTWVNRVKNALLDVDRTCRLSFSTSSRDFRVIKRIPPE